MAFTLIRGKFIVVGKQPDGDSIRFAPDDLGLLMNLQGTKPVVPPGGSVQVRLEGIDALETHFTTGWHELSHQPEQQAKAARDFLLRSLGVEGVQWNASGTTVAHADNSPRGYLLSRAFDDNKRVVAFAFAGDPPEATETSVFVEADRVRASANYQSVRQGFAYPTYYKGLFASLRAPFDEAVRHARAEVAPDSVWSIDRTEEGVEAPPLTNLSEVVGVMPKLFRRLSAYFREYDDLRDFKAFLEDAPDPCIYIPDADPTSLHRFVEVAGDRVRLLTRPENLLFL